VGAFSSVGRCAVGGVWRSSLRFDFIAVNPHIYKAGYVIDLVLAIVTTASPWMSNAKIETASLQTGEIELSALDVTPNERVTCQYHTSST
jgi:hypothetical protein